RLLALVRPINHEAVIRISGELRAIEQECLSLRRCRQGGEDKPRPKRPRCRFSNQGGTDRPDAFCPVHKCTHGDEPYTELSSFRTGGGCSHSNPLILLGFRGATQARLDTKTREYRVTLARCALIESKAPR